MRPCAYSECNITESLRLQKFQQDSCGVHNDNSRKGYLFRQTWTLIILSTLFVGLRCIARLKLGAGMGLDDWAMVAALNSYIIVTAFSLSGLKNNFGQHTYYLTSSELTESLKVSRMLNWPVIYKVDFSIVLLLTRNLLPPYCWLHKIIGAAVFHARIPIPKSPDCGIGIDRDCGRFSYSIHSVLGISMCKFSVRWSIACV